MSTCTNFEGPEKKLEIILRSPNKNLRAADWKRAAEAGGAAIVGKTATDRLDAYILSESSLFVWDNCILMITCGRTSLIDALDEILEIVKKEEVAFIFYERKNFIFPADQQSDFEQDAAKLLKHFPGKSYRLGPANHDHLHVFYWADEKAVPEQDATLQILMTGLGNDVIETFMSPGIDADEIGKRSGLFDIAYPGQALIDAYQFSPCGYSLNGLLDHNYYTVHITPQPSGSYTSFETNIIEIDYSKVTKDVISIFSPNAFSIALTTSLEDRFFSLHSDVAKVLNGYRMTEKSMYEFDCGYKTTFLNYAKL